ncbi:MAG TPA: nucleotidyl transferase AbiEii/AbiGii toxin family protein, partial [Candidatus Atribacteria bacterium]|nr:nucleotidyl transferase AbiEii/AbiGii toxin family protein [Candidatus Atribacteria bacterium]
MLWEEIINKSKERGEEVHQVFREEIQKAVIASLSHKGVFNHIVFQGGTALRLFYGNLRLSEDLDFVLREEGKKFDLTKDTQKIKNFLKKSLPFIDEVRVDV